MFYFLEVSGRLRCNPNPGSNFRCLLAYLYILIMIVLGCLMQTTILFFCSIWKDKREGRSSLGRTTENRKFDILILRALSGSYEATKSNFALLRQKKTGKVTENYENCPKRHDLSFPSSSRGRNRMWGGKEVQLVSNSITDSTLPFTPGNMVYLNDITYIREKKQVPDLTTVNWSRMGRSGQWNCKKQTKSPIPVEENATNIIVTDRWLLWTCSHP